MGLIKHSDLFREKCQVNNVIGGTQMLQDNVCSLGVSDVWETWVR